MKVEIIGQLKPIWKRHVWESGSGRYIGTARFQLRADEPIFSSVKEEGERRVSRKGTPLYEILDKVFVGRVGGHPFEITDVRSETEFTASFRLGYASNPPQDSTCEDCPDRHTCSDYSGPEDEEEEDEEEEDEDYEDEDDYDP